MSEVWCRRVHTSGHTGSESEHLPKASTCMWNRVHVSEVWCRRVHTSGHAGSESEHLPKASTCVWNRVHERSVVPIAPQFRVPKASTFQRRAPACRSQSRVISECRSCIRLMGCECEWQGVNVNDRVARFQSRCQSRVISECRSCSSCIRLMGCECEWQGDVNDPLTLTMAIAQGGGVPGEATIAVTLHHKHRVTIGRGWAV